MFATLGGWLTLFLQGYVGDVVRALALGLAPIALIWVTVYVANYGYAVTRGEAPEPLSTFGWKMLKITFILAIALSSATYMSFVFATADGLQDGMATIFLKTGAYTASAPATVFSSLDNVNDGANLLLKDLWKEAGISRLDLIFAGALFVLGTVAFVLVGAVVTVMSKVVLAFALAIGPIALLCLMFKPTARFFDAWLSLVLSAVVLAWFVFFALGLSFFVMEKLLDGVQASSAFVAGGNVGAVDAADTYLAIAALLAILLYQAPSLAASLTGGSSIQLGYQMVSNTLLAGRAAVGNGSSKGSASSGGGSITQGGGPAYTAGRATGAAASTAKYAYQRAAERGNRR